MLQEIIISLYSVLYAPNFSKIQTFVHFHQMSYQYKVQTARCFRARIWPLGGAMHHPCMPTGGANEDNAAFSWLKMAADAVRC